MRRFRYSQRADADMVGIARFSISQFGDSVRCESHVAFLTPDQTSDALLVAAVLHSRMDPTRHLDDPSE